MSENPFGFGGMFDPEDLNNAMRQFAEQAQESQSVAFADNAISLAVQMTTAAIATISATPMLALLPVRRPSRTHRSTLGGPAESRTAPGLRNP